MNKRILFFLVYFFYSLGMQAQPGFNRVYQPVPTHANDILDVVSDKDTLVTIAAIYDTLENQWGVQLMKLDTFGNVIKSSILSDSLSSYTGGSGGNKIVKTLDGGYAFSGNYTGGDVVFFAKYSHDFEQEFIRYFPLDSDMTFQTAPIVKQLDNRVALM